MTEQISRYAYNILPFRAKYKVLIGRTLIYYSEPVNFLKKVCQYIIQKFYFYISVPTC